MQYLLEYNEWVSVTESKLNEDWELGDWAHLAADVTSAIADSVVPGSGAVIDIIHALAYWVQSSLTTDSMQKIALDLQGVVSLASVAAIGVFQAAAVAFKSEIKLMVDALSKGATKTTFNLAKKSASSATTHAKSILKVLTEITTWLIKKIKALRNSNLGQWLISKFGSIDSAITKITDFLKVQVPGSINKFLTLLAKLNPTAVGASGAGGEAGEIAMKQVAKNYVAAKSTNTTVNAIATTTQNTTKQIASLDQKKQKPVKTV